MIKSRLHVKDVMSKNVKTCLKDTTVQEAARIMFESDCGAIPVVDSKDSLKPIGIVTDRDIVNRILAKGQNPLEKKVSDCMTLNCVTTLDDANISDCLSTMEEKQIRRIVVVDSNGKCKGIVSEADIASHCSEGKIAKFIKGITVPSKIRKGKVA